MSALDSLYGGGIAAQGIGGGLQGLVEGYRLKRELDNQALMGQSMAGYRTAMGNAAGERGDMASARADVLQKQLDNMNKGLKPDGSPAVAPGGSPNPAAVLTALGKTQYAADPVQLQKAMGKMLAGHAPDPFVPRAPVAAPAAPAQPGIMNMLGGKIRGMLGGGSPTPAAQNPSQLQPASAAPGAPAPGARPSGAYNWRNALQPQGQ